MNLRSIGASVLDAPRRLWWRTGSAQPEEVIHHREILQFADVNPPVEDDRIAASLLRYSRGEVSRALLRHDEYVIHCRRPVMIAGTGGWAMLDDRTLLTDSLPYTYCLRLPSLREAYARHVGHKRSPCHPAVLSLRDIGERNYYHCYNEILLKIPLAEKHGVPPDLPLVVGRRLFERPYFQEMLARGALGRRRWLVQGRHECVYAREAYFCKALPLNRELLLEVRRLLAAPAPDSSSKACYYLTRGDAVGRTITNGAEVTRLLRRFGFCEIEPERLPLSEQMRVFAGARYVVGIHGAGLTNLIFRAGAPLSLLEIFPPNNIPPHYYWLCRALGFDYDAILGETLRPKDNLPSFEGIPFRVSLPVLERAVERLLGDAFVTGRDQQHI